MVNFRENKKFWSYIRLCVRQLIAEKTESVSIRAHKNLSAKIFVSNFKEKCQL